MPIFARSKTSDTSREVNCCSTVCSGVGSKMVVGLSEYIASGLA